MGGSAPIAYITTLCGKGQYSEETDADTQRSMRMSEHDCNKCPYKRLCEEIEIKDLSCDDIKVIAQGSAEIGSLYEMSD